MIRKMMVPTKLGKDLLFYRHQILKQNKKKMTEKNCQENLKKLKNQKDSSENSSELFLIQKKILKNNSDKICKFFLNNSCLKGENCSFSHNIRKFPCKAFHLKKNCSRKICTYSHEPVSLSEFNKMMEEEIRENKTFISPFQ